MPKTATTRTQVLLPVEVAADIDKLVGKRGRGAFLTELAKREIELRKQRQAFIECAGAWKIEDHPELADGSDAWVRQIRSLPNSRFEEQERQRDSLEQEALK